MTDCGVMIKSLADQCASQNHHILDLIIAVADRGGGAGMCPPPPKNLINYVFL